jgi:hypothetical protein
MQVRSHMTKCVRRLATGFDSTATGHQNPPDVTIFSVEALAQKLRFTKPLEYATTSGESIVCQYYF